MCVHKLTRNANSDLNKISEYKTSMQTDIDVLNKFSHKCCYYDNKHELMVYQNDLSIMHLNVRNLLPKQADLAHLIKDPFVDVCLLNQTWLNSQNKNLVNIHGYNLVSRECVDRKGGGVGILIASYLSYKERTDLEVTSEYFEICVVELNCCSGNIIIVSLYRPPNSNDRKFLCDYKTLLIKLQKEKNKRVIIGCDHNFDFLKSDQHSGTRSFFDLNVDSGSWPIISKPSCVTKNTATLIDNIFVNKELKDEYDCGLLIDDISDHFPCYLVLHDCKLKHKPKRYMSCRKITPKTIKKIKQDLSDASLSSIVTDSTMDVNTVFDNWHSKVLNIIDKTAPFETISLKSKYLNKEPWLPVSLLKSIKKQKKLFQITLAKNSMELDIIKYKNYRNTLTRIKQKCKVEYYNRKCTDLKRNTKALWSVINNISHRSNDKCSVVECLKDGNELHYQPKDITNIFNNHFATVGNRFAKKISSSQRSVSSYIKAINRS